MPTGTAGAIDFARSLIWNTYCKNPYLCPFFVVQIDGGAEVAVFHYDELLKAREVHNDVNVLVVVVPGLERGDITCI